MIDFRYHVVSIIAVFLALALGLFLGGTTLQGYVFQDVKKHLTNAQNHVTSLENTVDQQKSQLDQDRAFDQLIEPYAVSGRLSGQLVVIVSAPGASGDTRSKLVATLERAGATVTADVRLQSALLDPKQDAFLGGLASRIDIPGREVPPPGTGAERVVAQLADVLGIRPQTKPLSPATIANVLSTYSGGNLLTTSPVHGNEPRPGTLAIVLTGTPPARTADPQLVQSEQTVLGALAKDLDTTSLGAVVVGPVADPSNQTDLVASIQSATGSGVSAVRGVDQSAGRIATVFALVEQLNDKFGSYGTVPGATPLPTPSP